MNSSSIAVVTHLRVVGAFVLREIATRYGRSPGGYVWAFLEPIAFIAVMATLVGSIGRRPSLGDSFLLFYATGYLAYNMYKAMEGYLTSSISANRSLMSYPVVAPIDAVVGRFILEAMTLIIVASVILSFATYTAQHHASINWIKILEATSLAWGLALGVAMTNIILFFNFPLYEKVYKIATRPLFLLSGVFYIPSLMPRPFGDYLLYNPVTHIVLLFRTGFYGASGSEGLDIWYLTEITVGLLALGFFLFTFFDVSRSREK